MFWVAVYLFMGMVLTGFFYVVETETREVFERGEWPFKLLATAVMVVVMPAFITVSGVYNAVLWSWFTGKDLWLLAQHRYWTWRLARIQASAE